MLGDSIASTINALLSEIKHYSLPPFNYGTEEQYKSKFIEALANLFFVLHTLDHVPVVDMDIARMSAHEAWNEALKPIPEYSENDSNDTKDILFSKACDSALLNKFAEHSAGALWRI